MATRRSSARRRRRKRRHQSRSRLPAILFAALIATVAGYLVVRASEDTSTSNAPIIGADTSGPDVEPDAGNGDPSSDGEPSEVADDGDTSSATDPSNLGKPVPIFSDALGDLSIDQVIDDWTPVDRPRLPASTAAIDPKWIKGGRITINLPDGYYWGVPANTFDEDERGINFDIGQVFWGDACFERFGTGDDNCLNDYQVVDTGGSQLYPSYLGDLLFVSFAVYGDTYSDSNVAVVPPTFWSLLSAGETATGETSMVTIPNGEPEPPTVAIANSPFLLTIVDGTIIAAEGIWIP